ncbi:MAG: hypothetical protein ABGZ49_16400 [Akkermansiaceae bacterium]
MYFIGVDNGTKRTRTVVLNLESTSLAVQSEQSYGLVPGLPQGPLGQDPSLCGHAVDHTVRDCLDQLGGAEPGGRDRSGSASCGHFFQQSGKYLTYAEMTSIAVHPGQASL